MEFENTSVLPIPRFFIGRRPLSSPIIPILRHSVSLLSRRSLWSFYHLLILDTVVRGRNFWSLGESEFRITIYSLREDLKNPKPLGRLPISHSVFIEPPAMADRLAPARRTARASKTVTPAACSSPARRRRPLPGLDDS
jgi:hypothetical protein